MKNVLPLSLVFRSLSVGIMLLVGSLAANASILYEFNAPFSGDPAPTSGSGPWIDAYFIDVTPGDVLLTVTNVNLNPGEFIQGNGNGASGGLYFNINPNDTVTDLKFSLVSANGNFGPIISLGENKFKADGDGDYDVQFDFSTQNFSVDSSITYEITGINNLTASDFEYMSAPDGGQGPFFAAAKVQGLSNGSSTYLEPGGGPEVFPTPEPASIALLTTFAGLLSVRTLRARRIHN